MKITVWIIMVVLLSMYIVRVVRSETRLGTQVEEQQRKDCVAAIASSYGTSTVNYTDKQAYDAHVRSKCDGFSINGKPVAP